MNRFVGYLLLILVTAYVLRAASPALAGLAHAAVPLIIAVGAVSTAMRIVWHFTNRY